MQDKIIYSGDWSAYGPDGPEKRVIKKDTSDYGFRRPRPTQVNVHKLLKTQKAKHADCPLIIKPSKTKSVVKQRLINPLGPKYIGLYCKTHGSLIQWVNDDQIKFLEELGVETIWQTNT